MPLTISYRVADRVSSEGRKGLRYDWEAVMAEVAVTDRDVELARLDDLRAGSPER